MSGGEIEATTLPFEAADEGAAWELASAACREEGLGYRVASVSQVAPVRQYAPVGIAVPA